MATENKVKFGLKNVHYAILKDTGAYDTPVAIPGAVNFSMDAEGEISTFRADNIDYYKQAANNGYSGELEIARIPDSFRTDVLGEVLTTTKKILMEKADAKISDFALGFEIDGDQSATRFWLLNCTVTRPTTEASTTEDTISPKTDKLKLKATANKDGTVKTMTSKDTTTTVYNGWFNAVVDKDTTA